MNFHIHDFTMDAPVDSAATRVHIPRTSSVSAHTPMCCDQLPQQQSNPAGNEREQKRPIPTLSTNAASGAISSRPARKIVFRSYEVKSHFREDVVVVPSWVSSQPSKKSRNETRDAPSPAMCGSGVTP